MRDVAPVPAELKGKVASVSDNLKPGERVVLNPKLVVTMFRDDIEQYLRDHHAKNAAAGPTDLR